MNTNENESEPATHSGPSTRDQSIAPFSNDPGHASGNINKDDKQRDFYEKCSMFIYNKEEKTYCGGTCLSWLGKLFYVSMNFTFLCGYTTVFLFGGLAIIKKTVDYGEVKRNLNAFTEQGIGLTATPVFVHGGYPLIWYKNGDREGYKEYIDAIEKLFIKNKASLRLADLGPCGVPPYGYGDKPCVIIKINKMLNWSANPLDSETAKARNAPDEVKSWIKSKRNMLWLHCSGYHPYDKEHIKAIKYYPNPPGFDPDLFPLDMKSESPLVAVQISDFTLGLSLAIECKLWYENATSTVEFLLYVTHQ